jgi:hypothetical protein
MSSSCRAHTNLISSTCTATKSMSCEMTCYPRPLVLTCRFQLIWKSVPGYKSNHKFGLSCNSGELLTFW